MTISGGSRDAPKDIVPKEPIAATRTRPEHWLVLQRPVSDNCRLPVDYLLTLTSEIWLTLT